MREAKSSNITEELAEERRLSPEEDDVAKLWEERRKYHSRMYEKYLRAEWIQANKEKSRKEREEKEERYKLMVLEYIQKRKENIRAENQRNLENDVKSRFYIALPSLEKIAEKEVREEDSEEHTRWIKFCIKINKVHPEDIDSCGTCLLNFKILHSYWTIPM